MPLLGYRSASQRTATSSKQTSGFLPPEGLRRTGLLDGTVEALALARDVFAGPAPAMPDAF